MKRLITTVLAAGVALPALAIDASLELGVEGRRFLEDAAYPGQVDDQWSVYVQPEFVWDADNANQRFTFMPYFRKDFADDERTHADVREAMFMQWGNQWELRAGIGKVFWGVTESVHLVDVINQTDMIEAIDGEEKLGQPMVHGIWLAESGTYEAFLLPGFRERTFAGEAGRYRIPVVVSNDAEYQANAEQMHTDVAFRWSKSTELNGYPLDVSAAVFRGTSRTPEFLPKIALVNGQPVITEFTPYYAMQNYASATLLYALDGWLLKTELLHRNVQDDRFEDQNAAVTGFEYTIVGPFESNLDLGLLAEYQYDSRSNGNTLAQNDLFLGARFALNDMSSSEVLVGLTQDLDYQGSRFVFVEGSKRLSANATLDVTLLALTADAEDVVIDALQKDDSIEVGLNLYF
ncbi:MAG: hypothetical protein P1U57_06340 [Oleibacter sp.]|nr:hypothetical protein [Thalassolituus sp.]